MADPAITRREFVRDGAITAAGVAVGLTATATVRANNPEKADTTKIVNYNPDMEYRRLGKTNLMISAVCMGGHWKRLDVVVPHVFTGNGWLGVNLNNPDFQKNRRRVDLPLHRSGHQLRGRLHGTGILGLRQGASRTPREDAPRILVFRCRGA